MRRGGRGEMNNSEERGQWVDGVHVYDYLSKIHKYINTSC